MKDERLEKVRHSLAHVMAAAVYQMFPEAKFGIGPTIENGFYYDFELPRTLIPEDLEIIENKMREILRQDEKFIRKEITIAEAKKFFEEADQKFKIELIEDLKEKGEKKVSIYKSGNFVDLCKGPHVSSTKEIDPKSFKLTTIAGAYWKGSEKNIMLQRIYGTAWQNGQELKKYLKMQAEAEKRDHRKLGQRQKLFFFHETAPGMPYWLPNGLRILNSLVDFWREEHQKRGYFEIAAPLINKKELYEISGHWDHYRDDMFLSKAENGEIYGLKPMNCPNAMVVFGREPRSYRELPLRLADTDVLHRNELSGTLNGLFRVRSFRQDDAHIFVSEEQIKGEFEEILKIAERFYSIFGIDYYFRLSTRPEEFMGEAKVWDKAEKELKEILVKSGKKYIIGEKEGAFYGPKIDIMMKDSLGREWQTGTIQLDFQIPERFKLKYTDQEGKEKTPVVIHRVIYGSLERFIGILLEHTAGRFPLWLAPEQIRILPVSDKFIKYGVKIGTECQAKNIRSEIDESKESLGKKIRNAELMKVPYILVAGEKEEKAETVAVRHGTRGDLGSMRILDFLKKIEKEIKDKK